MAAEKVSTLQKELAVLEAALKAKNEDAEEEAILARDAVVGKLQTELSEARRGKEEIEVALGRLVAAQEQKEADWEEERKTGNESMDKALRKVEKLPGLQSQLSEALQEKERLSQEYAEATGQLRVLQEGKNASDTAIAEREVMQKTLDEQQSQLKKAAKAAEEATLLEGSLRQQVGDLQVELQGEKTHGVNGAAERDDLLLKITLRDEGIAKARAELEEELTQKELLRSEMTGMKYQCEDLQSKLKAEREVAANERATAERDRELASAARSETVRVEAEREEMAEELDALKVQMRAMMTHRRPSTFTTEELEKCQAIFGFIRACDEKSHKQAEELLATGMPVDLTDSASFTPLMVACQNGARKVVKALLRRGASLNLQNQNGDTALHSCMPDHEDLAAYLIGKGADESVRNNNGKKWNEA